MSSTAITMPSPNFCAPSSSDEDTVIFAWIRTSGSACVPIRSVPWLCSISSRCAGLERDGPREVAVVIGAGVSAFASAAAAPRAQDERRPPRRRAARQASMRHDLTSFIRLCSVRCFSWYTASSSRRRCVLPRFWSIDAFSSAIAESRTVELLAVVDEDGRRRARQRRLGQLRELVDRGEVGLLRRSDLVDRPRRSGSEPSSSASAPTAGRGRRSCERPTVPPSRCRKSAAIEPRGSHRQRAARPGRIGLGALPRDSSAIACRIRGSRSGESHDAAQRRAPPPMRRHSASSRRAGGAAGRVRLEGGGGARGRRPRARVSRSRQARLHDASAGAGTRRRRAELLLEPALRAKEQRARGVLVDVEDLARLAVGEALDLAEEEGRRSRSARGASAPARSRGAADGRLARPAAAPISSGSGLSGAASPAAHRVVAGVDEDPVRPRREARAAAKPRRAAMDPQKRLLDRVLRVRAPSEQVHGDRLHAPPVRLVQLDERRRVHGSVFGSRQG